MSKDNKVFELNPNVTKVYQTADGFKFPSQHLAQKHANSLQDKSVVEVSKSGEVKDVEAPKDSEGQGEPKELNVDQTKAKIDSEVKTLEDLEAFREGEDRKGVLDYIAKKEEELKA